MSSVALYKSLIPAHAGVSDETISAQLASAARAHSASVLGAVYADAMVYWAASRIDVGVQNGSIPLLGSGDDICAPLLPTGDTKPTVTKPEESPYWQTYLGYVRSRSGTGPMRVGPPVGGSCR